MRTSGLRGLVFIWLTASACAAQPTPADVGEFYLSLAIHSDGAVLAREVFSPSAGEAVPALARALEMERADRISEVIAEGSDSSVEVGISRALVPWLRARWPARAPRDRRPAAELRYRVENAVERIGPRGRVRWPVLPTLYVRARAVRVEVTVPPGAVLLAPPEVSSGAWKIERTGQGAVAHSTQENLGAAPAELTIDFSIDGLGNPEPAWQFRKERSRQLAPSWVAAGLFLVITAVGILWMMRIQYPRNNAGATDRRQVARGLVIGGWTTVVVSLLSAAGLMLLLPGFGNWPQALPAGLLLSGALLLWAGRRFR